jgi:hypothetical protein
MYQIINIEYHSIIIEHYPNNQNLSHLNMLQKRYRVLTRLV